MKKATTFERPRCLFPQRCLRISKKKDADQSAAADACLVSQEMVSAHPQET